MPNPFAIPLVQSDSRIEPTEKRKDKNELTKFVKIEEGQRERLIFNGE